MRKWLFLCASSLLIFSCKNQNQKEEITTRYHDDGRAKPVVSVIPVIDSTNYDLSWSLSEEFTSMIKSNILAKGSLYLPNINYSIPYNHHPFSNDLNWIKNSFPSNEFVVFLELIQHENDPIRKNFHKESSIADGGMNLNMAMRIRILDLRSEKPQIVLQEVIKDSYYLSKNFVMDDYKRIQWGNKDYLTTPMGLAHGQISKDIVERINDYVTLAKSR